MLKSSNSAVTKPQRAAVAGAIIRRMPRYYFIVAYPGQEAIDDPIGAMLPGDTAAIESARRILDDPREGRPPEEPEPTIIVKNVAGEIVYRFPSN